MKDLMKGAALALVCTFALLGCRADPGDSLYEFQEDFSVAGQQNVESLPGPDPYVEGDRRLSFGTFYEGEFSDLIPVDESTVNYFIYAIEGTGEQTYSQTSDPERIEGTQSDRIRHAGTPWWGGGIHFSSGPRSLAEWNTLNISLNTSSSSMQNLMIGIDDSLGNAAALPLSDYGFEVDGTWQHLTIPLQDYIDAGVDLTTVEVAVRFEGGSGQNGDAILVDNLYFE